MTSERQRDNYCVDIPVQSSITLSANCPHCPTLPHHAPATILASQESPQFPRHQQPLGPDDTRDQELTFLWRDGWVGTGNTVIRSGTLRGGSEGSITRVIYYRRYKTLCVFSLHSPQHNFLTESHKNPGLARVIPAQSQPPLFLIITNQILIVRARKMHQEHQQRWLMAIEFAPTTISFDPYPALVCQPEKYWSMITIWLNKLRVLSFFSLWPNHEF